MSRTDLLSRGDVEKTFTAAEIINKIGKSSGLNSHLLVLGLATTADAIEITAFGFILNLLVFKDSKDDKFKLLTSDAFWSGSLTAAVFCGMLLGGLFCGYFADLYGRREVLMSCMFLNFSGALLSSTTLLFPYGFQLFWLLLTRLLCGLGVGGTIPSVFVLASEISPQQYKSLAINFVASFWMCGMFFTAIVALIILSDDAQRIDKNKAHPVLLVQHWPYFTIISALPAGISWICIKWYIKPSAVFLERLGRIGESAEVLRYFLATKSFSGQSTLLDYIPVSLDENSEIESNTDVDKSYEEINSMILKYSTANRILSRSRNELSLGQSLQRLFCSDCAGSAVAISLIWYTLSFASYGLLGWITGLFTKVGFNRNPYEPSLLFSFASVPGNLFALGIASKMSMKHLLILSMILSFCSLLLFSLNTNSQFLVLLGSSGFQCFSTSAWNALDALSSELFPQDIRSFSFGLFSACGKMGGISANIFNGLMFNSSSPATILFYTAFIMGVGILAASRLEK